MATNGDFDRIIVEFYPRLVALADQNLSTRWRGKFDPEDIAITVCRTFVRRYRDALPVSLDDEIGLWKLLVVITLNKVRNHSRSYCAQKRGGGFGQASPEVLASLASGRDPRPEEVAEYVDLLQSLHDRLDPMSLSILQLKLEGELAIDIAKKLDISTRTVSRRLQVIQSVLAELAEAEGTVD